MDRMRVQGGRVVKRWRGGVVEAGGRVSRYQNDCIIIVHGKKEGKNRVGRIHIGLYMRVRV